MVNSRLSLCFGPMLHAHLAHKGHIYQKCSAKNKISSLLKVLKDRRVTSPSVYFNCVLNSEIMLPNLYTEGKTCLVWDKWLFRWFGQIYDGVVGDVTITTKRSTLVDFTQPYTTSGLAVIVPLKQANSSYAWAFMRPFTPLMWITTGLFFFFTGLILWLLEHKKNKDFRGRPQKQVVTTLW